MPLKKKDSSSLVSDAEIHDKIQDQTVVLLIEV